MYVNKGIFQAKLFHNHYYNHHCHFKVAWYLGRLDVTNSNSNNQETRPLASSLFVRVTFDSRYIFFVQFLLRIHYNYHLLKNPPLSYLITFKYSKSSESQR